MESRKGRYTMISDRCGDNYNGLDLNTTLIFIKQAQQDKTCNPSLSLLLPKEEEDMPSVLT